MTRHTIAVIKNTRMSAGRFERLKRGLLALGFYYNGDDREWQKEIDPADLDVYISEAKRLGVSIYRKREE